MKNIIRVENPWIMDESGRKATRLHYDDGTKKVTSWARYIYELNYGEIPENYEVDHIDENCTNDNIDNLQLLTSEENIEKYYRNNPAPTISFICPTCKKDFKRLERYYKHNQINQKKIGPFCSRKCAGIFNRNNQVLKSDGKIILIEDDPITLEMVEKYFSGNYSYRKLAEEYNLHHTTVRYRIKKYASLAKR